MNAYTGDQTADLAAFYAALSPRARRLCPRGQHIDALLYRALTHGPHSPAELAGLLGGEDHGLVLTTGRIRWRLQQVVDAIDEAATGDSD